MLELGCGRISLSHGAKIPKNLKISVYELVVTVLVLDKNIVPHIFVDLEPVLLIAHVGVLPAGESRRGAKRWFAFQKQRGMPSSDTPLYGWVAETDWTLPQEDY